VQSFIAQGKLGFWAGLALPHIIAAVVVLLLFSNQLAPVGWFSLSRLRTTPSA
jgi:hypothetical protein